MMDNKLPWQQVLLAQNLMPKTSSGTDLIRFFFLQNLANICQGVQSVATKYKI